MSDYHLLGMGNIASCVTKVEIECWGNRVIVSCLLDRSTICKPFQLLFENVLDLHWEIRDLDELEGNTTELLGFILGEGNQRKPAIITTTVFELSIRYESLTVQTDSDSRTISPS